MVFRRRRRYAKKVFVARKRRSYRRGFMRKRRTADSGYLEKVTIPCSMIVDAAGNFAELDVHWLATGNSTAWE